MLASGVWEVGRARQAKQLGTCSWPERQSLEDRLLFGKLQVGGPSSRLSLLQPFGPCRWIAASLLTRRRCSGIVGGCNEEPLPTFQLEAWLTMPPRDVGAGLSTGRFFSPLSAAGSREAGTHQTNVSFLFTLNHMHLFYVPSQTWRQSAWNKFVTKSVSWVTSVTHHQLTGKALSARAPWETDRGPV